MSRFFVKPESVRDGKIFVSGDEAHHILDVMRLKKGDPVVVFDGTGSEYSGTIKDTLKASLLIEISESRKSIPKESPFITLIQAIPKKEKMDYIIEKTTELGVGRIVPVVTGRTVVRWDDAKRFGNAERWRRIALAAAKQCGRADVPEVCPVEKLATALKSVKDDSLKVIAALAEGTVPLKEAFRNYNGGHYAIAIGPEGDFTGSEIEAAVESGFKPVNLGQRVLKSDTAGLFVISAINYEFQKN